MLWQHRLPQRSLFHAARLTAACCNHDIAPWKLRISARGSSAYANVVGVVEMSSAAVVVLVQRVAGARVSKSPHAGGPGGGLDAAPCCVSYCLFLVSSRATFTLHTTW
jgi:hypothetical protein